MGEKLTRAEASAAVTGLGWRYVLGSLVTVVPVGSLPQAAEVARAVAAVDAPVRLDLRADRVLLTLPAPVTAVTTELAGRIRDAVGSLGLTLDALAGPSGRSAQLLEIAIDALDIPAVRPFWRAVMAYVDDPLEPSPEGALIDPYGQGPTIWFQQMEAPRPQRNRIHFDVSVPHDEAAGRIAATLAAGGTLTYELEAPAFWVLADPEGNEACVTTWQGRD